MTLQQSRIDGQGVALTYPAHLFTDVVARFIEPAMPHEWGNYTLFCFM